MKSKRLKEFGLISIVCALVFVATPFAYAREETAPMEQEIGTNLLANPGFEGIGRSQDSSTPNYNNWTRETFTGVQYGEIFTPEGWVTWWQEGEFKRPECKVIPNEHPFNADPIRIFQGYYSGMCFTFYGKQNAGYYQVVRNIPAGTVVEGSYYAHAWSCSESSPPVSCGDPYAFYFRVGIDPNGGTDPFSANIVWSGAYYHYDKFGLVGPVQATVGEAGAATMFIQAYGKWPNKHNDAYTDNPTLKVLAPGETPTPTPLPPPPTSDAPPTSQVTPTPRQDGAIVHIVVSGDTMFGLAIEYGVDLDELRRLNAGTVIDDFLSIGQEVIISGSPNAAIATLTPELQPTATPAALETPAQPTPIGNGGLPVAPASDTASLCVLAYYDANSDMFRQADGGEMALPNADINLFGTGGPAGTYKTDGISEPFCFQNLAPGNYILRHIPPPGYKLTDAGQWNIPLNAGQVATLDLGYVRDGEGDTSAGSTGTTPGAAETVEPTAENGQETGGVTKVLNTVLRISGIIVLVLAIAVGALFLLSRRSM